MGIVDYKITSAEPRTIAKISFERDIGVIAESKQKAKAKHKAKQRSQHKPSRESAISIIRG